MAHSQPIIIIQSILANFAAFFYQIHNYVFSGELVKELTGANRPIESSVRDVCVDGDTVIIPRYEEGVVLYYQLNYD